MDEKQQNKISTQRQGAYQLGQAMTVLGAILFAIPFFAVIIAMMGDGPPGKGVPMAFGVGFIGFVLIVVGASMMNVGRRGVAGSGLVLDPDRARKDLQPWSRMSGQLTNDALNEIDVVRKLGDRLDDEPEPAQQVIKVRCRSCQALNDETDKFCSQCGKPL